MSDLIFPTLCGVSYPIKKTPHFNTIVQESVSGVKKFLQCYSYPYYEIGLSFSYLGDENDRMDDIHRLMAFYNKLGGAGQDFLYADPLFEDNSVEKLAFGVGDGSHTSFRLTRSYGDYTEPVFGINSAPIIYVDDKALPGKYSWTWDKTGLITFAVPPTAGAVLKWTGKWFYRCHFQNDEAEFRQIFYGGWDLEELILETIKLE